MTVVLYFDTSALVKQYVLEVGSDEVADILGMAQLAGSSAVAKVELEAALAKYVRMSALSLDDAKEIAALFRFDWELLMQLGLSDSVVALASELVWQYALRGFDAIHLATAIRWQEAISHPITFATFDKKLWQAAGEVGLEPFPANLAPFLSSI